MSSGSSIAAGSTTSALTTDTRSTAATGRGRSGGRGRGRGSGRGTAGRGTPRPRSTGFRGTTIEMGGNVFECYEEQTDRRQYIKTVDALQGHVKKTMKYPEDLASLFASECRMPVLVRPPKPVPPPPVPAAEGEAAQAALDNEEFEADLEVWKADLHELSKRKTTLRGNLSAIHAVIWGQCSEAMKSKLKSLSGYETSASEDNCEWFLRNINAITMQFDAKHNGYISMLDATANFLNCRQGQQQTVSNYMETLKSHVDTIEYHGGTVVLNPNLAPNRALDGTPLSAAERMKISRDCTLAAALLRGADKTRYGSLITSLDNQFSNGKDRTSRQRTAYWSPIRPRSTRFRLKPAQGQREPTLTEPTRTALRRNPPSQGRQFGNDVCSAINSHRRDQRRPPRGRHVLPLQQHRSLRVRLSQRLLHDYVPRHHFTAKRLGPRPRRHDHRPFVGSP
jgi:hypothetical protein